MALIARERSLSMDRDLAEDEEEYKDRGFTFTPKDVKQIVFSVTTAKAGPGIHVTRNKGQARRVAAAATGVVDEKEVDIDMSTMPNPCDWASDDMDFW